MRQIRPDFSAVRNNLGRILLVGVICALLCWLLNFVLPTRYTASMIIGPKASSLVTSAIGSSSALASLGEFAGLGGLGKSNESSYDQYQVLLYGQDTAAELLKDRQVIAHMFHLNLGPTGLEQPKGIFADMMDVGRIALGNGRWHQPRVADVMRYLSRKISMTIDRKTDFITLSYENEDPEFSRDFLLQVHTTADGILRRNAVALAQNRLGFLEKQLQTATIADYRSTLATLILSETKAEMIGNADATYAVDIIDSPVLPQRPSSPMKLQNILAGFVFGILLAAARYTFLGRELITTRNMKLLRPTTE
jgi:hypothetical protein